MTFNLLQKKLIDIGKNTKNFKISWIGFEAIFLNVLVIFSAKIWLDHFCALALEHSVTLEWLFLTIVLNFWLIEVALVLKYKSLLVEKMCDRHEIKCIVAHSGQTAIRVVGGLNPLWGRFSCANKTFLSYTLLNKIAPILSFESNSS